MVIYEVNIVTEPSIREAYLKWLHTHLTHMLEIPGFITAKLLVDEAGAFVCHYTVESREALETYFKTGAQKMRQEAITLFQDQFKITRRILNEV